MISLLGEEEDRSRSRYIEGRDWCIVLTLFGFDVPVAEALTITGTIGGRALSLTINRNSRDGDMRVIGIGRRSSPKGPVVVIIIRCSSIELSVRPVMVQDDWRIYSVM